MKACAHCRYAIKDPAGDDPGYCGHPKAVRYDRVRGPAFPRLYRISELDTIAKETTDKCDAEGWFEEPRSWWRFW